MATPFPPLATVYATDEAIAIRAAGDYVDLCPEWQKLAAGDDGAFAAQAGGSWVLTSATSNFSTQGVLVNHVVSLVGGTTGGKSGYFRGTGELFAVESASGGSLSLRRIGHAVQVGLPPGPSAGLTAVTFKVKTFGPDIQEASYEVQNRYGVDPRLPSRDPSRIYDIRVLEQITILTLLVRLYGASNRTKEGDWALKYAMYRRELDELHAMCAVRWGSDGRAEPPTGKLSCRLAW